MDEYDYIDTGSYAPWDPSGSFGQDFSSYQFDPAMFGDGGGAGAGAFDFSSLFSDPYATDYTSMFDTAPSYDTAATFTDPFAQDTAAIEYGQSQAPGLYGENIYDTSYGQSLAPNDMFDRLGITGVGTSEMSSVNPNGSVTTLAEDGNQININPMSYLDQPNLMPAGYSMGNNNGQMTLLDETGSVVGRYNGSEYIPTNSSGISGLLGNQVTAASQQKAASGASGGGSSGGGGSQPKQEQKTATQSALSQAALIAQLLAALGAKGVKPPKPDAANNKGANAMSWKRFAEGGQVLGAERQAQGALGLLRGGTSGQSDKVPAKVSHGEYVMDADVVAALGDGNTEAGAAKLDEMRHNIRKHKRSAPANKIPPQAKSPLAYMKGQK